MVATAVELLLEVTVRWHW